MPQADEIIQILKGDRTRNRLLNTLEEALREAGAWHTRDPDNYPDWPPEEETWQDAWDFWFCNEKGWRDIAEIMNEVFSELEVPHVITSDEIANLCFQLYGIEDGGLLGRDTLDALYWGFLATLENEVLWWRRTALFPIARTPKDSHHPAREAGFWEGVAIGIQVMQQESGQQGDGGTKRTESSRAEAGEPRPLWERNGIRVVPVGWGVASDGHDGHIWYAQIRGRISPEALRNMEQEMRHLVPCAIRSIAILHELGSAEPEPLDALTEIPFKREEEDARGCAWATPRSALLPTVSTSLLLARRDFIRTCLDAYYTRAGGKKDTFDRRIRNAVILLAESDQQRNEAVDLALSVAAMEALLGQRGPELALRLATNVATLLEPDLNVRGQAREFVQNLYDLRSRALHGDQVQGEAQVRSNARALAAAVLVAVVSRRDFLSRGGFDAESPADLLRELEQGHFREGRTVGVDDAAYSVRRFWTST